MKKLFLEQERYGESDPHIDYKVVKTIGMTTPYVGQKLTKRQVDTLIQERIVVEITEKKK